MNKIKREIKREIGWGPMIVAVLMVSKVLGFLSLPADIISYGLIIGIAVYNLKAGCKFDALTAAFVIYIPISLMIITGPDPIFRAWQRFVLFIFLVVAVSPLVKNPKARDFRLRLFKGTVLCCAAIGVISFCCYFVGINFMRSTWDGSELNYTVMTTGTFGGLTSHSMLLAPISGIGALTCIYLANVYQKRIFWIGAAMCLGSVLFAASRSTLAATLVGACIYFLCSSKGLGKNMKRIAGLVVIIAVTSPLWGSALDGIRAKNDAKTAIASSTTAGVNLGTRELKWKIRIDEWESSPLFGVGFCSVSKEDAVSAGGKIEPGSSWLAVLSMTGAIGFILFCLLYFRACKISISPHERLGALIGGILVIFGVHMIAEGYIYSAGSFLCYMVWLTIGCATDYGLRNVIIPVRKKIYTSNIPVKFSNLK